MAKDFGGRVEAVTGEEREQHRAKAPRVATVVALALVVVVGVGSGAARAAPGGEGMSPVQWAVLQSKLAPREAEWPGATEFVRDHFLSELVLGAFVRGDDAPAQVAAALTGEVGASGLVTGHASRIELAAPADTCWLVLEHFETSVGSESATLVPSASDFRAVQPFSFRLEAAGRSTAPAAHHLGFCTSAAVSWRADVKLAFAGSKTAWRWVAVRWDKARLPAFVAARVTAVPSEACNPEAVLAAILEPVPGAVIWDRRGRLGFLATSDATWVHAVLALGDGPIDHRVDAEPMALPSQLALPDGWTPAACGNQLDPSARGPSLDARVAKWQRCEDAVGARFGPAIDAAEERQGNMGDDGGNERAQEQVDRLYAALEQAETAQCGPLFAPIQRDMDALVQRVADHFASRPALSGPDVYTYQYRKALTLDALGY
ncbi:MAG: hypothetical protein U1F43_11170 [Myxococcota bacterium]